MNQKHIAFPDLVGTIINELTNIDISLTSPLLKTKVLAFRIQNQELLNWANQEISGYAGLDKVPDYRITTGDVYADYRTNKVIATDQYVDIKGDEELFKIYMSQGIQTLETYTSTYIGQTFEGEQRKVLVANISAQHHDFQISRIYKKTPANFITDVLTRVRTMLLDVMLEMESKFDDVTDIAELKPHNPSITHFVHTIINNYADGSLINTGPHAKIIADIKFSKNEISKENTTDRNTS